ncbi:MAG: DUF1501 domain-containing protein [Acetobacteraceae bacterium]|nr:DUF1501 domain-containing protein [Acetobacteraceae bacterium]
MLSRRSALLGLGAAVSLGRVSLAMAAAATERRFVVVLLRGALDGLAAVAPYGDPAFTGLRGTLQPGAGGLLDLGGFYGLHPALAGMHGLYARGELLPVHAVAGPVRTRSHFEAQDLMESGAEQRMTSGWLNRAVQGMAPSGPSGLPLSVGVSLPLLLRGAAPVGAFAPQSFQRPQADLYARLMALHEHDAVTGPAIREGLQERGFAGATLADDRAPERNAFPALAIAAGKLLAAADGPRIAAMELGGWDTHAAQEQRLVGPLRQLDAGLMALKAGLGEAWAQTAVLVITEFGRTVQLNGTGGTDHGTGAAAFVAGGAVAGGRVRADWPGLAPGRLFEARDLQPTMDVRALAKGLLRSHLRLPREAVARAFPGSEAVEPAQGLLRG